VGFSSASSSSSTSFEPALSTVPRAPFELRLGFHGETGPGNRVQTGARDGLAGQFADAVRVLLDALERLFDFIDRVLIGGQQAQGEIAVEIVRAGIGHVEAVAGHFLG
jgi:hypothetical protein